MEDGTYAVSFVPDECGPYNVSIKFGEKDVVGSPFILQAHPTGEVIILLRKYIIKTDGFLRLPFYIFI